MKAKQQDPIALDNYRNLRIKEAADFLGCTVSWLRLEVKRSAITPLVMGRRYVFPVEEIMRYRSEKAQEAGCMAAVH